MLRIEKEGGERQFRVEKTKTKITQQRNAENISTKKKGYTLTTHGEERKKLLHYNNNTSTLPATKSILV